MKNDTRPFIKIRNHIFYYDKSYAMHNGGIVDMVVTYNADGSVSQMTMDDFIKQKTKLADYYDSMSGKTHEKVKTIPR